MKPLSYFFARTMLLRYKHNAVYCQVIAAAAVIASAACSTTTTSAKLRDPSQTALSFQRIGRASIRPIEKGSENIELGLAALDVKQPGSVRRENKALLLECGQCTDGNLTLVSEEGVTAYSSTTVSDLIEKRKSERKPLELEYKYEADSANNLYPVIETDWSNVKYFEERSEPIRPLGWLLAPGLFFTAAGVFVALVSSVPGGVALMVPGAVLDIWGILQLTLKGGSQRLDPHGNVIMEAKPAAAPKAPAEEGAEAVEEKAKEEPEKEGGETEGAAKAKEEEEKKEAVEEKAEEKPEKKAEEKKPEEKPEKPAEKPAKAKPKAEEKEEGIDSFLLK